MSLLVFANNATATLAGSITNTALTANLAPGTGALFANPTSGQYFVARFKDAATGTLDEIVWVTARSGDTITMIRGQEGTTALNWNAGDLFINTWTAGQAATMLQQGQVPFSSLIHIGTDTSSVANTIVATVTPSITSYIQGTQYNITIANTVTGGTQVNINGVGLVQVTRADGTPLTAGDLQTGQEAVLVYDGTHMQIANYKPYSGIFIGSDTSVVANTVTAVVSPSITSYSTGAQYNIRIANTNTGASQVNLNSVGNISLVRADGTALIAGDITAGQEAVFVYDGTKMQIANYKLASNVQPSYTANTTYYVNASTGSDSNNGLSSLTPFATIQKALDTTAKYNLNGYDVTINVAAGTYSNIYLRPVNGSGTISLIGNPSSPSTVSIVGTLATAIWAQGVKNYIINGFALSSTGPNYSGGANDPGSGINMIQGSTLSVSNMQWGQTSGPQLYCQQGSVAAVGGTQTIVGGSSGNAGITGYHIAASESSYVTGNGGPGNPSLNPTYAITTSVSYAGAFIYAGFSSTVGVTYQSLTGSSYVSGPRYLGNWNAIIFTDGGGTSYWPGSSGGTLLTGAQYG